MKKVVLFFTLVCSFLFAHMQGMPVMKKGMKMSDFRFVPLKKAQILQSGKAKIFCSKCGMSLPMFYRTNHAAKVNGKIEQFCSMHCLVEAMESGAKVTDIKVIDNTTLKFIPVSKAWYVVGSSKPATMSKVSKYAFGSKVAALEFAKKYGGKVMQFNEALAIAKKAFEKEQKMIKAKQLKMAQKGEKIYQSHCKKIAQTFDSVAKAKAYIKENNLCNNINGKELQAVGLYLINKK